MKLTLPPAVEAAVRPLLEALPPSKAMARLVPDGPLDAARSAQVEEIITQPAIASQSPLIAALWLYVDELDRSHKISQGINDATGSFWHGIMHRREGDFSNSHHWFTRAGQHPAMAKIAGYDPHAFIDRVEKAKGATPADLIDLQRREWAALFEWCVVKK